MVTNTSIKKHGRTQIEQARFIRRTLGIKVAAKYLNHRGYTVEAAVFILLGK